MMTRDNKKQNNDRGKCFGLPLVSNEGENLACEKAPCEGGKNSANEVWIRKRSEWESERESASEASGTRGEPVDIVFDASFRPFSD